MATELSVEEIFANLFCRERYYLIKHIPYFLQNFAPDQVQRAVQDSHAQAMKESAAILPYANTLTPKFNDRELSAEYQPTKIKPTRLRRQEELALAFDSSDVAKIEHPLPDHKIKAPSKRKSAVAEASYGLTGRDMRSLNENNEENPKQANRMLPGEVSSQHNRRIPKVGVWAHAWPNEHGIVHIERDHNPNELLPHQRSEQDFVVSQSISPLATRAMHQQELQRGEQGIHQQRVITNFKVEHGATRYALDEDRLTLTVSAPLRRLQQKTQVFPLDINSSSRSRLTHSYEVAAYGKMCVRALVERMPKLEPILYELVVCVENAAILHDLGNPPFGHFGEQVMRHWLQAICKRYEDDLTNEQIEDLCAFNGNAQGLRLVHSVQHLNLTLGQIAAFIKVPFSSNELRHHGVSRGSARRYAGVFLTEKELMEKIKASHLQGKHHPIALIMEQCDDLAYVLADLEDAYDRGILKDLEVFALVEELIKYLKFNTCHTTCDACVSVCTCAQGAHNFSGQMPDDIQTALHFSSEVQDAKAEVKLESKQDSKVEGKLGGKLETKTTAKAMAKGDAKSEGQAALKGDAKDDSKGDGKASGASKDAKDSKDSTRVSLDEVICDAIKRAYCQSKDDAFGVLQLVHGNEPLTLSEMMCELGVREIFMLLRECIATHYIKDIVDQICRDEINFFIYGELPMLHYGNDAHKAIDFLCNFEQEHIYSHPEVNALELKGAAYLRGILGQYQALLDLSYDDFSSSIASNGLDGSGDQLIRHLIRRISRSYKKAYFALCAQDPGNPRLEKYARIRMIIDYISGMTDTYVAHEFSILNGGGGLISSENIAVW